MERGETVKAIKSLMRDPKWYGFRRDSRDPRDREFTMVASLLPKAVDLQEMCPPVLDQKNLGSCVLHAVTENLRYLLIWSGKADVPLSRLQAYYDVRTIEGTVNSDAGCEIRDAIKVAAKIGIGHEKLWTYSDKAGKWKKKPTAGVYKDAPNFNAIAYERVAVNTDRIKHALALGFPVIIGVELFSSFETDAVSNTGIVPMPDLKKEQDVGGHAMLIVGYGKVEGHFTVRNSWAEDWGDKGNCYLPEAMVGSTKFGSDYWIIKSVG